MTEFGPGGLLDGAVFQADNRTMSGEDISTHGPHDAPDIPPEWCAEFEAAAQRSLRTRFRYAFIKTYKPVMDDVSYRSFDTTASYRQWCETNLPDWLGYGRV